MGAHCEVMSGAGIALFPLHPAPNREYSHWTPALCCMYFWVWHGYGCRRSSFCFDVERPAVSVVDLLFGGGIILQLACFFLGALAPLGKVWVKWLPLRSCGLVMLIDVKGVGRSRCAWCGYIRNRQPSELRIDVTVVQVKPWENFLVFLSIPVYIFLPSVEGHFRVGPWVYFEIEK